MERLKEEAAAFPEVERLGNRTGGIGV